MKQMKRTDIKEGKYLYCIIPSGKACSFGPLGVGGRGDELYTVCFNGIAAVVSNSPAMKYSVSRENTIAHEKAIEEVMKEYTVLPVRFCTIAGDEEKVRKILEKECENFKGLLNNLKDKKELGLKAIFKEDVYNDILEKYEDIKTLKAKLERLPPGKTHYQLMEIGRMVESALEKERKFHKDNILNVLSPFAADTRSNNTYGERMIINAAFLVKKDNEAGFDQKVQELDAEAGGRIGFKYITIVPPFNFVNLAIDTSKY